MLGARADASALHRGWIAVILRARKVVPQMRVPERPAWWWIGIYGAVNLPLIGWTLYVNLLFHQIPPDWWIFSALPDQLRDGTLYAPGSYFRWSPVAAWILAAIVPIGLAGWFALHGAALLFLRDVRMLALVVSSWAFWMDVSIGNLFIVVFIAALLALRGSTPATLVYFALCLMIPRPVQLPLLAWLLWSRPATRMPFIGLAVAHTALVLVSGYGGDWVAVLLGTPSSESLLPFPINSAPSAIMGPGLWSIVGVPLAAWLFVRGHVGWASLAISPYWLAQYWLMPLLELDRRWRRPEEARD